MAGRARHQGLALELGLRLRRRLQPLEDHAAAEPRLRPLHRDPAGAQRRSRQPVRSADDGRPGRRRCGAVHREGVRGRVERLRVRGQGVRRHLEAAGGPAVAGCRLPGRPPGAEADASTRRSQVGDVTGYGGNNLDINADRTYYALFTELAVPIVRNLEGTLALRYDHYSDFGDTVNPKLGAAVEPDRSSCCCAARGARASSRRRSRRPTVPTPSACRRPAWPTRCAARSRGDTIDCLNQFNVLFGGNSALKPQKANQWQVGFVLEPVQGVLARRRLLRHRREGPLQQRSVARYDPVRPRPLRQPGHARPGAAGVPEHPGPDRQHRPALHQPGRGADQGLRRRRAGEPAADADRALRLHAQRHVLPDVRRATDGRHVRRLRGEPARLARHRRPAALQAVRDGHVVVRSVVDDPWPFVPHVVRRRADGCRGQPAPRRQHEPVGPATARTRASRTGSSRSA